ncbi:MAG: S8 family serine peptidase, partial [Candidatus Binatia bacterium]
YEPGEILVANPPPDFESIVVSQGYRVGDALQLRSLDLKILRLRTPSNVSVVNAVRRLRQQFPQATTDANTLYELSRGEGFPESYARMLIGWPGVPKNCGAGVHLGMIDAGVQPDHPALTGTDIRYRSFHEPGRQPGPANHGTAVAAMLVGKPQAGKGWGGLLPGARLSAANIFQFGANRKIAASARGLLEAIDWMVEQRVHVVNMSIAGSNNNVVRQVVKKAGEKGLVVVAAAGNWGTSVRPAYPAAYSDVIAVTAVDANRRIYEFANSGPYIDFAAPGVRVWTAIPGGGQYQSGTSFASPYVSVLTGLVVSRGHPRDPEAVRKTLRGRVVDLGTPGRDDIFGWGLVDMQPRCVKVARNAAG